MPSPDSPRAARLFVSYASRDRSWAEWVAWQLEENGFEVELDVWDWAAGDNFMTKMRDALDSADRVVALLSPAYFEPRRYTTNEWSTAMTVRGGMAACFFSSATAASWTSGFGVRANAGRRRIWMSRSSSAESTTPLITNS